MILFHLDERVREIRQNKEILCHLGFNRKLNYVETKITCLAFLYHFLFTYDENRVDFADFLQKIPRYFPACMLKMELMTKCVILNQTGSRFLFRMPPYQNRLYGCPLHFYQVSCLYHK